MISVNGVRTVTEARTRSPPDLIYAFLDGTSSAPARKNTGSVPALSSPSRRIHVRPQPSLANDFVIHGINFYCALLEEIDDCGLDVGGASAISMLSKTASRMTSCAGAMRSRQIAS